VSPAEYDALRAWLGPALAILAILVGLAVTGWVLWRAVRGDPVVRRRRQRALLSGAVTEGSPFDLRGRGSGSEVTLFVDMEFGVPWADIAATLAESGFRFEYCLTVGEQVVQQSNIQLPRDRKPIDSIETQVGGGGARLRATCPIAHFTAPHAAVVRVTGSVRPLEQNTLQSVVVWVG